MDLTLSPLISRVLTALAILVVATVVYRLASRGLGLMVDRSALSPQIALILRRTTQWLILVLVVFLLLESFGVLDNAWALLTAVVGLIAIGFVAVWSVLSNVLCSLVLLLTHSYRVGDVITMPSENIKGTVVDFNVIFTTLRDAEGEFIQIPNNLFLQKPIKRRPGAAGAELQDQLLKDGPTYGDGA